jgi:hypothetical protein
MTMIDGIIEKNELEFDWVSWVVPQPGIFDIFYGIFSRIGLYYYAYVNKVGEVCYEESYRIISLKPRYF